MSSRDGLVPARLTGTALMSAGGAGLAPARLNRRTAMALDQLEQRSLVAEAIVASRARLIHTAARASMHASASIHSEAVLLAQVSPAAADALARIASATTAGLTQLVLDASQ